MTWKHVHREEAPMVGEPDDASVSEITGVAPPCDECGKKEAVEQHGKRDLCEDCLPEE